MSTTKQKYSASVCHRTSIPIGSNYLVLSSVFDEYDNYAPFSRIFKHKTIEDKWSHHDTQSAIIAFCLSPQPPKDWEFVCQLSEEGEVQFGGKTGKFDEKIPEAGVTSPDAKGWGYMSDIQQIGDHLYACGNSGQVYKRLGANDWVHMDAGLLQDPETPKDREDRHWLNCIRGVSEDEIYVAGDYGLIWLWNGTEWKKIPSPERSHLNQIHIESPDRVWICGGDGALLRGNHRDGFVNVNPNEEPLFTSLTLFENQIYLASNLGLYTFDEKRKQIRRVKTPGLTPPHKDTHSLGAKDGVLWSVGVKDIVWFDGKTWHRVQNPDNPPYGEEETA